MSHIPHAQVEPYHTLRRAEPSVALAKEGETVREAGNRWDCADSCNLIAVVV
jgi:hypothetical protein